MGPDIVLDYLTPTTFESTTQNSSSMNFSLVPSSGSCPPILNAAEFFNIPDQMDVPTTQEDGNSLLLAIIKHQ